MKKEGIRLNPKNTSNLKSKPTDANAFFSFCPVYVFHPFTLTPCLIFTCIPKIEPYLWNPKRKSCLQN